MIAAVQPCAINHGTPIERRTLFFTHARVAADDQAGGNSGAASASVLLAAGWDGVRSAALDGGLARAVKAAGR